MLYPFTIHRSPSNKNPLENTRNLCLYLKSCLLKLPKRSEVFLLVDFNMDWFKNNGLSSHVKNFSRSSNLGQLLKYPTRITETSSLLFIDLIFPTLGRLLTQVH